jgi:hypothetical protein
MYERCAKKPDWALEQPIIFQMYDRPKRGAITILFRVSVQRHAVRMHFPAEEISDIGFFDRLPTNATPSAKFFWEVE